MNMTFKEKYQHYSVKELLRIIENANDYQPLAVEAAREVLAERNPGRDEMDRAMVELNQAEADKKAKLFRRFKRERGFK